MACRNVWDGSVKLSVKTEIMVIELILTAPSSPRFLLLQHNIPLSNFSRNHKPDFYFC